MIYRERGEGLGLLHIECDSHGGSSVMVLAGVFLHHKTNIFFHKGELNCSSLSKQSAAYRVISLLRNHRGMQLLHDGAAAHRTRATTAYLNANNVNVLDFPPKSSD